jgi:hypothetical protein
MLAALLIIFIAIGIAFMYVGIRICRDLWHAHIGLLIFGIDALSVPNDVLAENTNLVVIWILFHQKSLHRLSRLLYLGEYCPLQSSTRKKPLSGN